MAEPLTPARLFSDPPLFGRVPQNARFIPDGSGVAFLRVAEDDRERLDLWRLDLASGQQSLWVDGRSVDGGDAAASEEEQAERERRRQFAGGITRFEFSADGRNLLLPVAGTAFLMDLDSQSVRAVTPPGTRQTDMRFAPDGASLTYVRDGDLYRFDLQSNHEIRLTADGGGPVKNGIADFIAQEEMHRFEGYWWSPDSAWLAFTRVDDSPVAVSRRFEIQADAVEVVEQRYPYAGARNADVRLVVMELASGETREIPWHVEDDDYLARVDWVGARLAVQRQSRDQQTLELTLYDPRSGDGQVLVTEQAQTWVNLHDNFHSLCEPEATAADFLWTSERSGRRQLYRYRHGELTAQSDLPGRVDRLLWADRERALVSGWADSPTEQHLFEISLTGGGAPVRLTGPGGWHDAEVSADGRRVLDRYSNLENPGCLALLDLNVAPDGAGASARTLVEEVVAGDHPYLPYLPNHSTPELGTLNAEDGQVLCYRLTRPLGTAPAGGHPAIVYVYGGPGVQRVRNEWPPALLQLLAQHGFVVLELDNRGSSYRDPGFEAPIHYRLGAVEVRDQSRGARFLAEQDDVDPDRIGVFGHSYGGYMTLMCLLQAPDLFKAGVAVAPVTDWTLYDTHYTERYLGTPAGNPQGYRDSAVLGLASGLSRPLLLVHGMADDNVLFTHTTKLMKTLQDATRPFELMTYPGSKHALQERSVSVHRFEALLDFFQRHL